MQGEQFLQSKPEMVNFTFLTTGDIREEDFEISSQSPYLACQSSKMTVPVQGQSLLSQNLLVKVS